MQKKDLVFWIVVSIAGTAAVVLLVIGIPLFFMGLIS